MSRDEESCSVIIRGIRERLTGCVLIRGIRERLTGWRRRRGLLNYFHIFLTQKRLKIDLFGIRIAGGCNEHESVGLLRSPPITYIAILPSKIASMQCKCAAFLIRRCYNQTAARSRLARNGRSAAHCPSMNVLAELCEVPTKSIRSLLQI
jgi:hypothetical protein